MTEQIHMKSHEGTYLREFQAKVEATFPGIVELDRTAFYPLGGGQPSDKGELKWNDGSVEVNDVRKKNRIRHMVEGELPEVGESVEGTIDWTRRYAHMKMHTAQHVVSAVVDNLHGARTVGNQIGNNKSRIDFDPLHLNDSEISELEAEISNEMKKDHQITITEAEREDLEENPLVRVNMNLLPPSVKTLRVITIGNLDICPCAGTHVKSTKEIGEVRFKNRENKGKGKQRLSYELI
ncbi:MAG: alanyl-tRNA editing protein [Dehalococcoidia bacterium]|nr:alanyl-tRNA editing protein [Dehalococcoidia bacterium]